MHCRSHVGANSSGHIGDYEEVDDSNGDCEFVAYSTNDRK